MCRKASAQLAQVFGTYRLLGPTLRSMPVEFLTDDEAAAYGRYAGMPSQADLERVFFLDDEGRALVDRHRGST